MISYTPRNNKRKFKAGQLLEFTLIMPMVVILITFSVDMGRLALANTSLSDASAVAARAGARVGYAGGGSGGDCNAASLYDNSNISYNAFCQAARVLAGSKITSVDIITPTGAGAPCGMVNSGNEFVTVKATANMRFMTPGLAQLFNLGHISDNSDIVAYGTAKCEVTR